MGIVRPIMEIYPWAWAYFVPFILIATFTMLNLFIAIIVSTMQTMGDEPRDLAPADDLVADQPIALQVVGQTLARGVEPVEPRVGADPEVPFTILDERIRVRDSKAAGGFREERLPVRLTRRGPVITGVVLDDATGQPIEGADLPRHRLVVLARRPVPGRGGQLRVGPDPVPLPVGTPFITESNCPMRASFEGSADNAWMALASITLPSMTPILISSFWFSLAKSVSTLAGATGSS